MKRLAVVAAFTLVGLGFVSERLPPVIRGELKLNPHAAASAIPAHLEIFARSGTQVLGKTRGDAHGRFVLTLKAQPDSLDLFCLAPGMDTLFLRSIAKAAADTSLQLLFPCEPDTTSGGDILCPKCRQEDQVLPITYGEPIVIKRHFDTTGKVSYERLQDKETATDTVIRAARFYCRRDKINF